MPVYSLARAATEAGRSRSTLLAAIRAGRLSATRDPTTSAWLIDASELYRVFPPGGGRHGDSQGGTAGDDRADSTALIAAKDALIMEQRAMLDDLRRRLDASEEERRRLTLVLADQRTPPSAPVPTATPDPPRRAWWRWGRG
jgi:hypothetical protein